MPWGRSQCEFTTHGARTASRHFPRVPFRNLKTIDQFSFRVYFMKIPQTSYIFRRVPIVSDV